MCINKYGNEEVFNRIDKLAINIHPRVVCRLAVGLGGLV